jgi:pyruvate dehydrogenase E2 component (dihydrolipoamide acetyltransferase)
MPIRSRTKLSATRRTIARRLTDAWQAPVFHLGVSAAVDAARARVDTARGAGCATLTDELVRCTAVALSEHPSLNAHLVEDELLQFTAINVGLAVPGPNGLTVPVLHDVGGLSLGEIAVVREPVVERARQGTLRSEDVIGATFTISNLGMHRIERFDAILNPPSVAILAVGAGRETPVAREGALALEMRAELTLSCDHRAVDGVEAAAFLMALVAAIEGDGR